MAAPVNTVKTADLVGIREDLADVIYNVDPEETPLFSALAKGKADGTFFEWQTDTLRASGDNAHVEGDDSSAAARTATVRVGNYCQIFKDVVQTSDTEGAVDKAGRAGEMAYQLVKIGKEQKLDYERALFLNRARSAGSSVAPRYTAGLGAWIATNDTQTGSGGASPSGNGTDTRTDGTTTALTQTRFDATAQAIWDTCGGKATSVFLGSGQMNVVLGFTGSNGQHSTVSADTGKVIKDVVLYRTPWGVFDFTLSRECRARDVWLLNTEKLSIAQLRPMKTVELAKTGDSEKRHIVAEWGLKVHNEAAHGLVPDNS